MKEIHPDNFDQTKDRARWEKANEQLKELNEAYSILKNQDTRASHDKGAATGSPPPRRPRSPDWDIKLGKLKAGMAWFVNLPKSVQDRILERTTGKEQNQFAVEQGGIGLNYFFALLQAWNICHIIKWRRSPLRAHLIITPLYVIKTSAEQVGYWASWSHTSVLATHHYKS